MTSNCQLSSLWYCVNTQSLTVRCFFCPSVCISKHWGRSTRRHSSCSSRIVGLKRFKGQKTRNQTSSQIFSSDGIQLVARWQFWSTTHEPSAMPFCIILSAIGPWAYTHVHVHIITIIYVPPSQLDRSPGEPGSAGFLTIFFHHWLWKRTSGDQLHRFLMAHMSFLWPNQ